MFSAALSPLTRRVWGSDPALVFGRTLKDAINLHVSSVTWLAVGAVVAALLLVDLLVLNRHAHVPTFKRALSQVVGWVSVGLVFGLWVIHRYGTEAGSLWYTGYLVELSLSVDNVFVWALILSYFAVPRQYQHRVLFWGIFGAIALRAIFIFVGVALLNAFEPLLIVFGLFLIFTAWKLMTQDDDDDIDPDKNPFLRFVRRVVPSTDDFHGQKLFVRLNHKRLATPLFAVLVLVETTDVLFAVDSVPAALGVTRDQFLVLTSNAFAILGLRALYFLLADMHNRFEYLQKGLAVILAFVGLKMVTEQWLHLPTWLSLAVIVTLLVGSVLLSILRPSEREETAAR
jgi:tellurite resistance protein TerC